MIHLEKRHHEIVYSILKKYPYQFYVFGSRARGNPRPFSDLDLCFEDQIPEQIIAKLEMEFKESDLPFVVELTDFNKISQGFREIIEKDLVLFE